MLIVADENIPLVHEAFADLGEVRTLPGRDLRRADLDGAELLLVRSVTRVDSALLAGSAVRFVASATIGRDHLDSDWLDAAGIGWATAPGCNARAVAEWVIAALLRICHAQRRDWRELRCAVIGYGNVGRRVAELLGALALDCLVCDPPLAESGGVAPAGGFVDLDTALDCDLVSLHTPLSRAGRHPTAGMLGAAELARMRCGSLLFNSGRGAVIDGAALLAELRAGRLHAALDVWPGEPRLDPALLRRVALGTPHIAGYSYEGRVRGTQMIRAAAGAAFGATTDWPGVAALAAPADARLDLRAVGRDAGADPTADSALRAAVEQACDVARDDADLRAAIDAAGADDAARGAAFDGLRRAYRQRREFPAYGVTGAPIAARGALAALGFSLLD